jgi:hypothetical protein
VLLRTAALGARGRTARTSIRSPRGCAVRQLLPVQTPLAAETGRCRQPPTLYVASCGIPVRRHCREVGLGAWTGPLWPVHRYMPSRAREQPAYGSSTRTSSRPPSPPAPRAYWWLMKQQTPRSQRLETAGPDSPMETTDASGSALRLRDDQHSRTNTGRPQVAPARPGAHQEDGGRSGGPGVCEAACECSRRYCAAADARRQPADTSHQMLITRRTACPPLLRSPTNPSKANQPPKKRPQKGVFVRCHHGLPAATCHSLPNRAGLEQRLSSRRGAELPPPTRVGSRL